MRTARSTLIEMDDNFLLILKYIFYLDFADTFNMKDKNMTTYGVDFAVPVECSLCKEIIPVGYAGPNGLAQHQGKKKC